MTMQYKCEKCECRFPIDVSDFCPDCPACKSIAVRLEVSPNENIGHVDDDNLCHSDTSKPDRAFRDAPVGEELLFLGAWMVFLDCSDLEE